MAYLSGSIALLDSVTPEFIETDSVDLKLTGTGLQRSSALAKRDRYASPLWAGQALTQKAVQLLGALWRRSQRLKLVLAHEAARRTDAMVVPPDVCGRDLAATVAGLACASPPSWAGGRPPGVGMFGSWGLKWGKQSHT